MDELIVHEWPEAESPTLVVGLTGWMDGGHVSTGALGWLRERLEATRFAEIDPMDFYLFNFPVSSIPISIFLEGDRAVVAPINPMEFAAVFRPHTHIRGGVVEDLVYPANDFWVAPAGESGEAPPVVMFTGEEPHIRWGSWCDCIFGVCAELDIRDVFFVGSVASPVPHTREPRIRASVSDPALKQRLVDAGLGFGDYEGPSSIITALTYHAADVNLAWHNLVVEVPHYPFLDMPTYPHSILTVAAALNRLVGLDLDLSDLEQAAAVARGKLDALAAENDEFRQLVTKLEQAYDQAISQDDEELLRRLIDTVDLEGMSE